MTLSNRAKKRQDARRHKDAHRRELCEQGVWTCSDGREIVVAKIEDSHLCNIAVFMWRQAGEKNDREIYEACAMPGPNGEMAQLSVEQGLDYLMEYGHSDEFARHPFYLHLVRELDRRDLWKFLPCITLNFCEWPDDYDGAGR